MWGFSTKVQYKSFPNSKLVGALLEETKREERRWHCKKRPQIAQRYGRMSDQKGGWKMPVSSFQKIPNRNILNCVNFQNILKYQFSEYLNN